MENILDNMSNYSLTLKRGIDDLLPEYAFKGNSQGDESVSNDIKELNNPWMSWCFEDIPKTQEAIDQEVAKRREANAKYIAELTAKGEFGKEFEYKIHIKHNPIFDRPAKGSSLESHKMIFINDNPEN